MFKWETTFHLAKFSRSHNQIFWTNLLIDIEQPGNNEILRFLKSLLLPGSTAYLCMPEITSCKDANFRGALVHTTQYCWGLEFHLMGAIFHFTHPSHSSNNFTVIELLKNRWVQMGVFKIDGFYRQTQAQIEMKTENSLF